MRDQRFWFGIAASCAWLAVMVGFIICGKKPAEISAWGDFFAGFFAPIAFLWLVLGYLQQGEELRNSSRALELQVEELRSSVEQQAELVRVTAEQHQLQVRELESAERRRRAEAQPVVDLRVSGAPEPVGHRYRMTYTMENTGGRHSTFNCRFHLRLLAWSAS